MRDEYQYILFFFSLPLLHPLIWITLFVIQAIKLNMCFFLFLQSIFFSVCSMIISLYLKLFLDQLNLITAGFIFKNNFRTTFLFPQYFLDITPFFSGPEYYCKKKKSPNQLDFSFYQTFNCLNIHVIFITHESSTRYDLTLIYLMIYLIYLIYIK